jgi:hypothetical protein
MLRELAIRMKLVFITSFILYLNPDAFCQADTSILNDITKKFQNYCKSFPREEIYVHTDRDLYIAGEEIRFSIFLFDRQTETLTGKSRIAYFEILNPANRPVVQKRTGLYNGTGSGLAVLPDTLSPGTYTLRAYTNWMKNFMPDNCFTKKLKIFRDSDGKYFFVPEGSRGIAEEEVPVNKGISASINVNDKGFAVAEIISDKGYRNKNKSMCYLFLQTHGVVNYKSPVSLKGDTTKVGIPEAAMIPGINHLTIFDSARKPVSEVYSYTPGRENDIKSLNVISPDSCQTREQVQISIETPYSGVNGDTSFLAVSVVPSGTNDFMRIDDYMVFASEFGVLPDLFYNTGPENIPDSILKKFLGSARSSWIDWDKILAGQEPEIHFKRESSYHYLYGNVYNDSEPDSSIKNYLFMSVPGKIASFQYSVASRDGGFEFSMPADDNFRDIVIQSSEQGVNKKIVVTSSFSDRYSPITGRRSVEAVIPEIVPRLALNFRVMKIYRSFEPREVIKQVVPVSPVRRFYGKPDFEMRMSDYIKLPTMQEVFFELLPGVAMRPDDKGYQVSIRDPIQRTIHNNPLLMIDGVVIRDPALVAALDPGLVEKIDVIKTKYIVGDYSISGLINLITIKGDLGNTILPGDAARMIFRAYESGTKFILPDYSVIERKESHLPDFRNTLFSAFFSFPVTEKKQSLSFFVSDFVAEYDIVIQGVTSTGRFFFQKRPLKIQK